MTTQSSIRDGRGRRPRRRLAWLAVAALCPVLAAAQPIELPDMGASANTVLSPQKEKEIGEAFMREVRKELTLVDDPEVEDYVQHLGQRLAASSDNAMQAFTFFVVKDPQINAFAAPGGYIGVNSGLILTAQSESELAAVLAHEIAHVTQRHIARRFEVQQHLTVPTIAAIVAAILIGTRSSEAGTAALAATQAGAAQMQINFTRGNEEEADRVGIKTLAAAGFDPRSMASFFERMQRSMRYYTNPPEFLLDHPVTAARIADAQARAGQYPYHQVPDSVPYQLVRAKLEVLTASDPTDVLERFRKSLETKRYDDEQAARYGYALALKRTGHPEQAYAELKGLEKAHPDSIPYMAEAAKLAQDLGHEKTALDTLREGVALYPDNRVLVVGYAEALLRAHQAKQARDLLTNYARNETPTPAVYELLARTQQEAGDIVEARLARAEYEYLMGRLQAAIHELERAQKESAGDYYKASRVEARLAQLKEEAAQRKDEKKDEDR